MSCAMVIHDSVTIQRVIAADCVYIYGVYGIPQSLGEHELEGGLHPHWAHSDVLTEGFRIVGGVKKIGSVRNND